MGSVKSKRSHWFKDITGNVYGSLTVLHLDKINSKNRQARWWCKCECGNEVSVRSTNLLRGHTTSCGCLKKDIEQQLQWQKASAKMRGAIGGTMYAMLTDKLSAANKSGVRGVTKLKNGKYGAYIGFKRRLYPLGRYNSIEEAAAIRKEAEKRIWGDFKEWYETRNGKTKEKLNK